MNRGLPKMSGGIAKREREAWTKPCTFVGKGCENATEGLIETISGPMPICRHHGTEAEGYGYKVRWRA